MSQIQFHNGAILFEGSQIALDPACCCGCTCEEAAAFYSHASIAVSSGATSATFDSAVDNNFNCLFGTSEPVDQWNFPGISNASEAVSALCTSDVVSAELIASTPDAIWGGYLAAFPQCTIINALPGGSLRDIFLSGVVSYVCIDNIYNYNLTVEAAYYLYNPDFDYTDYPDWTWTIVGTPETVGGGYIGEKTIGGVDHVFRILMVTTSGGFGIHQISLGAVVHDPDTTVTLGTPPYDPHGLLVGTATLT